MLPLKTNVPPGPNVSVAPATTENDPLQAPPQVPPPLKLSVPPLALFWTDPVLLTATPIPDVPVPPLFLNVPALLNTPGPTPTGVKSLSPCRSTVEPDGLLNVAPDWN